MSAEPLLDDSSGVSLTDIELIDLFSIYPNKTLIYHGYIRCAPLYPTAAILLCTLAAYHQIHRSSQVKSLCFLHDTPYQPYLNIQFSAAYDVYLEILHCVKQCLHTALNHDTPNWRMLNSCPACFYKLEDEPVLDFDWLSDYWLDTCDVDRFKDEVKTQERDMNDDNWEDETIMAEGPTTAFNWIFIAVCCHRFVVLACDMIWSGELAKYSLAIIEKLLTIYGKNGGCAYDIGCAFSKTLTNSSLGM
ncbi:hypothetical protein F4604DRAFT_1883079 [Suillus subluteus]|nr:hypothetical protein F4604DRAFT_1883079 [Suillus subluteus]